MTTSNSISKKTELSVYLSEPRVIYDPKFDLLNWWKINEKRFSVLAKIARDYLAIQARSTNSEGGFSGGGLICTKLRNRLHPETLRWLMCLQSWFKLNLDD